MNKSILTLAAIAVSALLSAAEPFVLQFNEAKNVTVGGKNYTLAGEFVDGKYMLIGKDRFSIPGGPLVAQNQGTLVLNFKLQKLQEPLKGQRVLMHLRTGSTLTIGFNYYANAKGSTFQFQFTDRSKNGNYANLPEKLEVGKDYQAAITWDGSKVKYYFDGKLIKEVEQKINIKAEIRLLNIGHYRDGWQAPDAWPNDTLVRSIAAADHALTAEEIAKLK